jgi:hypothetical protein
MSSLELVRGLEALLEKGFDDSFAVFCAAEFSSHRYPPANLAPARMHAFHLRLAIQELTTVVPPDRFPAPGRVVGEEIKVGGTVYPGGTDPALCIVEETRFVLGPSGPKGGITADIRREIAARCFEATLRDGGGAEGFSRLFIRSWCMYFSRKETGH